MERGVEVNDVAPAVLDDEEALQQPKRRCRHGEQIHRCKVSGLTITKRLAHAGHELRERNHQGLDNQLIEPDEAVGSRQGGLRCCERLGGLLKYYYREAA